jgi:GDP-L-fucose synthase
MTADGFPLAGKRIWVAGHRGMVGAALCRRLAGEDCMVLTVERRALDLRRQDQVEAWMQRHRPDAVIIAAATVGGIQANSTEPARFLYDNLMIASNIIHAAHALPVAKLVFLGSNCIYPKHAAQPVAETALLTGPLEPTNEAFAVAKLAGITLCQAYRAQYGDDFITLIPTGLYGPGDNFDPASGHVLPALLRRIHEAHQQGVARITLWGSGTPLREFLHVDDLADAAVHALTRYSDSRPINVGSGEEIAIADLARLIARVVGYGGQFVQDRDRPDGTPRKLLDSRRLFATGWAPSLPLEEGLRRTYRWYLEHEATARVRL